MAAEWPGRGGGSGVVVNRAVVLRGGERRRCSPDTAEEVEGGRLLSDQAAKKVQGPQVVRIGGVNITGGNTRQDGEARDLTRRRMIMSTHRPEGSKGLFATENDRFRQTRYLVPG